MPHPSAYRQPIQGLTPVNRRPEETTGAAHHGKPPTPRCARRGLTLAAPRIAKAAATPPGVRGKGRTRSAISAAFGTVAETLGSGELERPRSGSEPVGLPRSGSEPVGLRWIGVRPYRAAAIGSDPIEPQRRSRAVWIGIRPRRAAATFPKGRRLSIHATALRVPATHQGRTPINGAPTKPPPPLTPANLDAPLRSQGSDPCRSTNRKSPLYPHPNRRQKKTAPEGTVEDNTVIWKASSRPRSDAHRRW